MTSPAPYNSSGGLSTLRGLVAGFSHMIYACSSLDSGENFFDPFQYPSRTRGHGENPPQKKPFAKNPLPKTFELSLLGGVGLPAIELLCEKTAEPRQANPLWTILGGAVDWNAFENLDWISQGIKTERPGLYLHSSTDPVIKGLLLRTRLFSQTLHFWEALGFKPTPIDKRHALISLRGLRLKQPLRILIASDEEDLGTNTMDQVGIVCLSLLCRDADVLNKKMSETAQELEMEVGECFSLTPLGKPLRLFFARTRNGELYEFLSPAG